MGKKKHGKKDLSELSALMNSSVSSLMSSKSIGSITSIEKGLGEELEQVQSNRINLTPAAVAAVGNNDKLDASAKIIPVTLTVQSSSKSSATKGEQHKECIVMRDVQPEIFIAAVDMKGVGLRGGDLAAICRRTNEGKSLSNESSQEGGRGNGERSTDSSFVQNCNNQSSPHLLCYLVARVWPSTTVRRGTAILKAPEQLASFYAASLNSPPSGKNNSSGDEANVATEVGGRKGGDPYNSFNFTTRSSCYTANVSGTYGDKKGVVFEHPSPARQTTLSKTKSTENNSSSSYSHNNQAFSDFVVCSLAESGATMKDASVINISFCGRWTPNLIPGRSWILQEPTLESNFDCEKKGTTITHNSDAHFVAKSTSAVDEILPNVIDGETGRGIVSQERRWENISGDRFDKRIIRKGLAAPEKHLDMALREEIDCSGRLVPTLRNALRASTCLTTHRHETFPLSASSAITPHAFRGFEIGWLAVHLHGQCLLFSISTESTILQGNIRRLSTATCLSNASSIVTSAILYHITRETQIHIFDKSSYRQPVLCCNSPLRDSTINRSPTSCSRKVTPKDTPLITTRKLVDTNNSTVSTNTDCNAWESVGGMAKQIIELRECVELPIKRPNFFHVRGMKPPRGILLYGPPGTGKTTVARAVAKASGAKLIVLNGAEIVSRFLGESEARLRQAFAEASSRLRVKSQFMEKSSNENFKWIQNSEGDMKTEGSILFIDEIDALAPPIASLNSETDRRIVATLLNLIDDMGSYNFPYDSTYSSIGYGIKSCSVNRESERECCMVLMAATNRPHEIEPALRRPGRLDREIEIGVPTEAERESILRVILQRLPCPYVHQFQESRAGEEFSDGKQESTLEFEVGKETLQGKVFVPTSDIQYIASKSHGFVGADLQMLCSEALIYAANRHFPTIARPKKLKMKQDEPWGTEEDQEGEPMTKDAPTNGSNGFVVTFADLCVGLSRVRPSALREVAIDVPSTNWDDIGGNEQVKLSLREMVEWPLKHPEAFSRFGVSPPNGVLLYGPPGCSKTLIARALATESGMNFLAVQVSIFIINQSEAHDFTLTLMPSLLRIGRARSC